MTIKLHIIFLLTCSVLFSQNINLTGKITDSESGDPLVGANIIIDGNGLNTGAATNNNGTILLKAFLPVLTKLKLLILGMVIFLRQ